MREMKDSGFRLIGKIPTKWTIAKAKNCVEIQNGSDPKTEGSIPVYGSGSMSFKTCGEYKEGPSVLIGRKGATLHIPHYISSKFWNVDTAFNVYSKSIFDLKYYFYCAHVFDYTLYMSQTTLPSMTQTAYENMFLPLPTKEEQYAIANQLDQICSKIDAVLEKTRASIEEYKKLKQAVITQVVTKGVRGDRPMKDSGSVWFEEIPCNWVMKRIKYLFHIKKDIAGKEGYTVLSITQRGIQPKDLSKNEGQIAANYSQYQLLAPGDFAMNHMDLLTGWVDISKYSGVTSPDYRVFVLDDAEKNDSSYYLYLMQMCYFNRIFYGLGQGVSGMGRWRLQADNFLNFPVVVPPVDEQKEIVSYLNEKCKQLDTLIRNKQQYLTEIENYKKSLIYEYVTGKKEVHPL